MAANSWRNTSFGLDQNSTKSNRKAKHGARRKGLFALSAAAGAVGFIGLSPHAAKADVLANLFATVIPNPCLLYTSRTRVIRTGRSHPEVCRQKNRA